jgi:hypothetical protein
MHSKPNKGADHGRRRFIKQTAAAGLVVVVL